MSRAILSEARRVTRTRRLRGATTPVLDAPRRIVLDEEKLRNASKVKAKGA